MSILSLQEAMGVALIATRIYASHLLPIFHFFNASTQWPVFQSPESQQKICTQWFMSVTKGSWRVMEAMGFALMCTT